MSQLTKGTDMNIRDWNPAEGQAFQGDIILMRAPDGISIATADEVRPIEGRLILQEGEVSGHHHAITLERPAGRSEGEPARPRRTSRTAERLMSDALANRIAVPTARLYRDDAALRAMALAGLRRTDLCIGFLVVEGAPALVSHEEHDGIRVPPGVYYCGRQVESAGAEERIVAD